MKHLKIFLFLVSFFVYNTYAQNDTLNIISLNECINLALKNSPELNMSNSQIKQAIATKKINNNFWLLDNMAITGNSQYVYRRHFNSPSSGGYDPIQNINTYFGPQSNNYVGLSLNLPLNTWRIKKYTKISNDAVIDELTHSKQLQINQIKQEVITLYHQLESANNTLQLTSKILDIQRSLLDIAKKNLSSKKISNEEYLTILQSNVEAENSFNAAKIAYEQAYYNLKLRVGTEIIK